MIQKIGKPIERVDGRPKVTGSARYAAENNLDNIVHAALVTSTIPCGRITSIDATEAERAPGVLAVLSHLNAPKLNFEPDAKPKPGSGGGPNLAEPHLIPFADGNIQYLGQRIAVVVADTIEHAMHAADLVRVTYDARPARTSMDEFRAEAKERVMFGRPPVFSKGDADAALAAAPVTVDQVYRTPYEHHNMMEPHAIVAVWDGDRVTLYDSSQNIFAVRRTLAQAFGVPRENVRIVCPFVGGAFGSKGSAWPHVVIGVLAARVVKRPVKLVVTRRQLFFANGHRPETEQRVALGATPDGKLTSIIHEGIGQANLANDYVEGFTAPTKTLYAFPAAKMAHRVVELDLPSPTFMRAPGESPGSFALESAMDELAYTLKMDPIALRLVNHADVDPSDGKPWSSKSLKQCYEQAAERFGWSRRLAEPRSMHDGRLLIGQGMASATYPAHQAPCSARATLRADGTVLISSGSHELGTGTATVMGQLAAETLGVPVERVSFRYGDTTLPEAPISAGSMTVASVGTAVFGAVTGLKEKVLGLTSNDADSPLRGATADQVAASEGRLSLAADSSRGETYAAILNRHYMDTLEAQFDAKPNPEEPHSAHAFGAQFAEVSVDQDLGIVRVRRMVSAFAAGRILNARTARSQCIGGIIQGIGMALMEKTHLDRRLGSYTSVNLGEYIMPVNADIPDIDVILVEEEDPHVNPIGAKGIGEIPIVGVAAAIANAVYHATGKRVRELPITVDKLL